MTGQGVKGGVLGVRVVVGQVVEAAGDLGCGGVQLAAKFTVLSL